MRTDIAILDEQTINKIAAGEVIESPASVVKELVENALDAKSTKITVQVQGGGFDLLSVQDNGIGMNEFDLKMAPLRHATSKIRTVEDIFSLKTMGFRGEALSSIASISELAIRSSPQRNPAESILQDGFFCLLHAGVQKELKKTSCFHGTTIEVKKLFYNVPARRKFQKSPEREGSEILKIMTHIALSRPDVSFDLVINGRKEFSLIESTFQKRVEDVLGKKNEFKYFSHQIGSMRFEGCISDPKNSRPNRLQQYLFINTRSVSSLALSYAVKDGYGAAIEKTRHPIFVLHIQLPEGLVDVNVHPQKKEVRFQQEEDIKKALTQVVQDALFPKIIKKPMAVHKEVERTDPPQTFFVQPELPIPVQKKTVILQKQEEQTLFSHDQVEVIGMYKEYLLIGPHPVLKKAGLYFVDMKRALSRISYEELLAPKNAASQKLLVPYFLELQKTEATILLQKIPSLCDMGFDIREFGVHAFIIEAIPASLDTIDLDAFLKDLISHDDEKDLAASRRKIAMLASKRRILKQLMNTSYAKKIIDRLFLCQDAFYCPYGKPIFHCITDEELTSKF